MKTLSVLLAMSIAMVGCVDVTMDEPSVCNSTELGTIPAAPVNIPLPPQTLSTSVDLSGAISQLNSIFSSTNISVQELSLSGTQDLSFLKEVDVMVDGGTANTPNVVLASYKSDGSDPGDTITLQVKMDSDTIFKYFQNPVALSFTVSGEAPTKSVTMSSNICMDAQATIQKSL
jgi:hypothetical protein